MKLEEIGLNTKKINLLNKKKIYSVEELLYTEPKKYLYFDKTYELTMSDEVRRAIESKEPIAFIGKLISVDSVYKNNKGYIKMRFLDERTNNKLFINCFGEYFRLSYFQSLVSHYVIVGGVIQYSPEYKCFSMINPLVLSGDMQKNNKIIPIYKKVKGISEEAYEEIVNDALREKGDIDYIPIDIILKYKLPSYKDTITEIHKPTSREKLKKAQQRLIFDHMLYFACKLEEQSKIDSLPSSFIVKKTDIVEDVINNLPFKLTNGQNNAVTTMIDMAKRGERISSLVQGDVGSGKTIVALLMMIAMAENGYQSILMAPTAVLAKQHADELARITEKYGFKTVFLSNALKTKEKKYVLQSIKNGECDFIVGTHSCISKYVEYANLGLTITDEEHKFGVLQREALLEKAEQGVHNIIMSGTPIPRTLANTLYGNKSMVFSMELPSGRKPIQTAICSTNKPVFDWTLKELEKGHQAYVVCPLIEKMDEESIMHGVKSVEEVSKEYKEYFEPLGYNIGIVTGKTDKMEQTRILNEYKENKIQILVATTIVEVGVNVPNATVMIITGAERFGLATLHQ